MTPLSLAGHTCHVANLFSAYLKMYINMLSVDSREQIPYKWQKLENVEYVKDEGSQIP